MEVHFRQGFLRISLLAMASAMALAGCQQQQQEQSQSQTDVESSPETKPGLQLSEGVLMLPVVAGRPGAAYFTLTNDGKDTVTIAAVHIDGSENAEIHETRDGSMAKVDDLKIAPGESVTLARGGLHVMVFGLSEDLGTGQGQSSQTEMTLTFSDGDKLSAPLAVEAMTKPMDMAHHDHGDMN